MKHSELAQAVLIAVVLSVIFVVSYAVFGQTLLLRPFWMDEIHSWLLISDPDPFHALHSLQNGADYNPPVYYSVARIFSSVVPLTEHNLRALSALLMLSTAIGLALVFDRHMKMPASIGCSLFICSQELMVLQATEVRFYALWLALLTWFCFGLTTGKRRFIGVQLTVLSVLAALTAGTHYFGVISIGIVCCAFMAAKRFEKQAVIRAAVPLLAAVCTVACCLPMLKGQKAALTTATWVVPADLERSFSYLVQFFPSLLLLVAVAIWLVGFFLKNPDVNASPTGEKSDSPDDDSVPPDAMFVFGSLLLMPVVLIGFSVLVQPTLVNRYSVVGCLWLVPAFTFFLRASDNRKNALVLIVGCVMFALAVRHGSATWQHNLKRSQDLVQQLNEISDGEIVLFEDRIDYWMLQHADPNKTWFQLDFETEGSSDVSNLKILQRDVGRAIQPLYPGRFPMKRLSDFENQDVYVVPYVDESAIAAVTNSGRILTDLSDRIVKASAKSTAVAE